MRDIRMVMRPRFLRQSAEKKPDVHLRRSLLELISTEFPLFAISRRPCRPYVALSDDADPRAVLRQLVGTDAAGAEVRVVGRCPQAIGGGLDDVEVLAPVPVS